MFQIQRVYKKEVVFMALLYSKAAFSVNIPGLRYAITGIPAVMLNNVILFLLIVLAARKL